MDIKKVFINIDKDGSGQDIYIYYKKKKYSFKKLNKKL